MTKLFLTRFLLFWFFVFSFTDASALLKRADIQSTMQELFLQHIEKKEITKEILSRSLKTYLEQFDPDGIYLLQSEVLPYFNPTKEEMNDLEIQWRAGDFSSYEKLNDLIQKAILRSRTIRASFEQNPNIFKENINNFQLQKTLEAYPTNELELKNKIKQTLIRFVQMEAARFGKKAADEFIVKSIAFLEKHLRAYEDQYTYKLENGEPLSAEAEENLFTIHVLKAIAKTLDAHTAILDSNEAYDMRMRLKKEFDGVGIGFQETSLGIIATQILEDSPAFKDGSVKIGDRLIQINGISVESLDFAAVMDMLREEVDEPITLIFIRGVPGQESTIKTTLKRAPIIVKDDRVDVSFEQFGNGILGVITLHAFYQNDEGVSSEKDVRQAILDLEKKGPIKGLILDLRENSGGFLLQAVKVAGLFITDGIVVISKYSNGSRKVYRDLDSRVAYSGPLIILTSRATASAAEIVAQTLQDYGVAVIVGDDQTYGKGTIQTQTVTDKKGGTSFFKVTVGKYYTVSGKTPQLHGVKSDIIVPSPYAQIELGEEYLSDVISGEDVIADAYKDKLEDVDPFLKPWYLQFYVPNLQHKEMLYTQMIPELKKNSAYRISKNKNYQFFLKTIGQNVQSEIELEKNGEVGKANFGVGDMQKAEALNILKDMIILQSKYR